MTTPPILISEFNDFVWGFLVDWILYVGVFFTLGLEFKPLLRLPFAVGQAWRSLQRSEGEGSISLMGALMTALAGNIGTGSLAGMVLMLSGGGAGALFWMWVATVLGIATKFAEGTLAVRFRNRNDRGELVGGPMYYIRDGLPASLRWLGTVFALLGALATFGKGNVLQSMELAKTLELVAGVPHLLSGGLVAAITLWTLRGGIVRISRLSGVLVPLMVIGYLIATGALLTLHRDALPGVLQTVFSNAFSGKAVVGGTLFVVISSGIKRAVFAQEIGMGTTAISTAVARPQDPVLQGLVAGLGGLVTGLVGTMTSLVVLSSGVDLSSGRNAISTLESAFSSGLGGSGLVVGLAMLLFTLTTIVVFGYYGERCLEYVLGSRSNAPFRLVWVAVVVLSSVTTFETVWSYTSTINSLVVLPNLLALIVLSGTVFRLAQGRQP